MLRLGKTHKSLTVVCDQVGSPTYTPDLAELFAEMITTDKFGRYHATNEGYCSWYDFACEIFKLAGEINPEYKEVQVSPVTSDSYPTKAKRPSNSCMSKEKLIEYGFSRLLTWQDALQRYINVTEV